MIKTTQVLVIIVMCYLMTSCFFQKTDLNKPNYQLNRTPDCIYHTARVYTMRGLFGVSVGMDMLAQKVRSQLGVYATPLYYYESERLSKVLIDDYKTKGFRGPIVLIGHSFGADEQIKVAKRLNKENIPVDVLITLDHTKRQTIPANVRHYYNLSSGSFITMLIPWGVPLQAQNTRTHMTYINLATEKRLYWVHHFNIDRLKEVHEYIMDVIKHAITVPNCQPHKRLQTLKLHMSRVYFKVMRRHHWG